MKIIKNKGYIWILGGGRMQYYNLIEAKNLGYKTIITDDNDNCFCRTKADFFFKIDIFDIKKNIKLLNKIKNKINIKSVFIGGIDCTVTAATLAEKLGLVTSGKKIAEITNNKFLFRKFLQKNNLLDFPFLKVSNVNNITEKYLEKKIGYPFIVKNTDNSASRGMEIIKKSAGIKKLKSIISKAIKLSRCGYCTIEKYFVGSEHTVETIFDINGKFHPCFITDRYFDHKSGKAIEIGLRNPTKLSKKMQKKIFEYVKKISQKIGIKVGPAKFDLLISNKKLIVLEMTTRLSGGYDCQILVPSATGKNIIKAAILTSLGKKFDKSLLKKKFDKVAYSGSVWPKPGKIIKINYTKPKIDKDEFLEIIFNKKEGDKITNYESCADRSCFVIASSTTENKTKKLINKAKKSIQILTA
jgi:biotin carboxylase